MSKRYTDSDYISPEWERKHLQSIKDAEGLEERPLICPHCGYLNAGPLSDLRFGHMIVSCRKCKLRIVVDFACFKRDAAMKKKLLSDAGLFVI